MAVKPDSSKTDKNPENKKYHNTKMNRELVLEKLRASGYRITRQREVLLDIILEQDCASCKEIILQAAKKDKRIGAATVYRMINALEGIGAVSRKITYQGEHAGRGLTNYVCKVVLDDDTVYQLNRRNWNDVVTAGLGACGYLNKRKIASIQLQPEITDY